MTGLLPTSLEVENEPDITSNQVILQDNDGERWLRFHSPIHIITTQSLDEVVPSLKRIEDLVENQGYFAAGFISYEAAPAFDRALVTHKVAGFPLIWFGIYQNPEDFEPDLDQESYKLDSWRASVSKGEYAEAISQIKELIARGRTYQVNYTLRLKSQFNGSARALFYDLIKAQESRYAAFIDTGSMAICSASPELFFKVDGSLLESRPMKGTAPRGRTVDDDGHLAKWLYKSEKNRAENVMIVDMIRNDIGRVSEVGSVDVPHLFQIERYPTLWQMTSTVTGTCHAGITEIMTALFPCASITGAPKVSTMQIISALETEPRGIYTGCIGYLAPGRMAQFNVAIRTVVVNRQDNTAGYGVGGGIVWGSETEQEFEEWQTKARILTVRRPEFQLLESILWTRDEGYFLLDRHLKRLSESARYFGFICNLSEIRHELERFSHPNEYDRQKIRLVLSKNGSFVLQNGPVGETGTAFIRLAPGPIDESDLFHYHKTTNRQIYDRFLPVEPGVDDVLLWNSHGEVTETTVANIVVKKGDKLLTPPVSSGLLGGTFRQELLDQRVISEAKLTIADLENAEQIYLINSVRKWRNAFLIHR